MGLIMKNGISYGGNSGGSGNANIVKLTQAEYDALPESKNSDGILYAITDGECSSSGSTSKPVELTKAQYEALGDSVLTDGILYAITDGDELSAKNLEYDGSVTGLGNNVQVAIDKLNSNLDELSNKIDYNDVYYDERLRRLESYLVESLREWTTQTGSNTFTATWSSPASQYVAFPKPFINPPENIVLSKSSGDTAKFGTPTASNITEKGFTLSIPLGSSHMGSSTKSVKVTWSASEYVWKEIS